MVFFVQMYHINVSRGNEMTEKEHCTGMVYKLKRYYEHTNNHRNCDNFLTISSNNYHSTKYKIQTDSDLV